MSDEISLLPEGLRKKEEELMRTEPKAQPAAELKFSMPAEEGEDIEVIEVDEGEIEQVLAGEPLVSRIAYRVTNFFDLVKTKLFQPTVPPPPPKLPPQFFAPPPVKPSAPVPVLGAPKPVPLAGAAPVPVPVPTPAMAAVMAKGAVKPKTQVIPSGAAPRRVRVIRRVRKPVRISFVSEDELKLMHIDISKRRFTFITISILFTLLLGGSYALLAIQLAAAQQSLTDAKAHTTDVDKQITDKQGTWSSFQDLEPRLIALGGILDKHVSPTHLLDLIEKNTLPTVSYGSFSLTPDGKVALSVTADSLEAAAGQVVAFQKSGFVKKVDASSYGITYTEGSDRPSKVAFQLTLTLSDIALHPVALVVIP